jgi:hypothetical protein
MTKDQFITERTNIISRMLDNPDEYGIYPTTKCFEELDGLFEKVVGDMMAIYIQDKLAQPDYCKKFANGCQTTMNCNSDGLPCFERKV